MYIYKITNIINGKVYIGQTIRPIQKRFNRHINDAINKIIDTHFARAIRKYGKDNFTIELIDTANTQEELTKKEQQWIKFYNSTDVDYGYNETDSEYKSGGNTYQSKTAEEMKKISKKLSEGKLGKCNPNFCSVKCLNVETNEELFFDTVNDCRIHFREKNHRFITTRVTNQTHCLYKGKWKISYADSEYFSFYEKTPKKGCSIEVYDIKRDITLYFCSIRQASRELKISRERIYSLLDTDNKSEIENNYIIKKVLN